MSRTASGAGVQQGDLIEVVGRAVPWQVENVICLGPGPPVPLSSR